jgi:hypothetical protein
MPTREVALLGRQRRECRQPRVVAHEEGERLEPPIEYSLDSLDRGCLDILVRLGGDHLKVLTCRGPCLAA